MISDIYSTYGVSNKTAGLAEEAMKAVLPVFEEIDSIREYNQLKVLAAFRELGFAERHMGLTTGYGYDDIGREKIEEIYAKIFGGEKAYVRTDKFRNSVYLCHPLRNPKAW